jgi:hypothetical protein
MGSSFDSTNPSPWYHQKQVGECLEQWWLHNQRIRWICKKWLNAVRCRIMSRRAHGLTGDIGTCEAIPANHLVRVYDWPSRSVYHFHTYTIQKSVVAALKYQYFGISYPSVPKNPYTNLAWSYAQLIVLLEQCQTNLWLARRRYMDAALIQFVGAGYDLLEFEKRYRRVLDIECARAFFMDPTTDGWMEIYEETLTDLLDLMKIYGVDVKSYVMARSLPADMLSKWDEVVMAYWIFENHHRICLKDAEDLMDILEYAQKLVGETRRWLGREREVLRRRRRPVVHQMRRTPNPVFGAQGAFMFTPVQPMSPPRFPSDAEATSISTPTSPPHPLEPISPMVATAAAVVDTTGMTPLETIDQILATVERAMRTIESCDEMRIGPVDVGSPESPETTDPPQESDAPAAVNSDEL